MDLIVDQIWNTITEANVMDASAIKPKIRALLKIIERRNNTPDWHSIEKPTDAQKRLRALQQKEFEIEFWKNKMRELNPDKSETLYHELRASLKQEGFI